MGLRRLAWLVPVALFFLNPTLACDGGSEFQYDAADMRAAVEGTWLLTLTPEGGSAQMATVHIQQASATPGTQALSAPGQGWLRQARACGTRTLVSSAGACEDLSQMPLSVNVVAGDAIFTGVATKGMFTVYGLAFASGQVDLTFGDRQVSFTLDPAGNPANPHSPSGPATISRLQR